MSIAWVTVVLAVLLLPGVCFHLGVRGRKYLAGGGRSNAIAELSIVVFSSLILEGLSCFVINFWLSKMIAWVLSVDLTAFFTLLNANTASSNAEKSGLILSNYWVHILAFFSITGPIGSLLGFAFSGLATRGIYPFSSFLEHAWVYQLIRKGNFIFCTVFMRPEASGKFMVVTGILSNMEFGEDEEVASVVLASPIRSYIDIAITNQQPQYSRLDSEDATSQFQTSPTIFIPGAEITYILFEARTVVDHISQKDMEKAFEDACRKLTGLAKDVAQKIDPN